jgi:hypothetical protein
MSDKNKDFINPIDPDKIAENPGLLPYAHSVSGALIKPEDMGKVKSRGLSAMEKQTENQLKQIYGQIEILARQAKAIKDRIDVSARIYIAEMNFEPLIGHVYYLYQKNNGKDVLTMVSPQEWGKNIPFSDFIAKVELLADHTWEIQEMNED